MDQYNLEHILYLHQIDHVNIFSYIYYLNYQQKLGLHSHGHIHQFNYQQIHLDKLKHTD